MPRATSADKRGAVTGLILDPEEIVPVPGSFLADVLPSLSSIEEIQVCFACFRLLDLAGGFGEAIAEKALVRDRILRAALRVEGSPRAPDTRIGKGLDLAIARGTLLRIVSSHARKQATFYYLNTPENRSTVRLIESGELAAPRGIWPDDAPPTIAIERPNAFRLYEQNIGPLTPLIADHISRAIEEFPDDWIEDALEEAVAYNRRSWRYVTRILENWRDQGRQEREN